MKKIVILSGDLEIKKNYIIMDRFEKSDYRSYYRKNNASNQHVDRLATLFKDHGTGIEWLLDELLDTESKGIFGSLTRVKFRGNKIILEPSRTLEENPEDYTVEIGRDILIRLATDWQSLAHKEVPEIFIFCKNGEYFVSDTLPEGID
jgi:hypothetical protein